jgi:hypothetical protein
MGKHSPEELKRLDDRMAEMDRLRSDPTMKLVRTKSGKFQYVSKEPELKSLSYKDASKSKPATAKPATAKPASNAYKPGSAGDTSASSAKDLIEGFSGRRGTGLPPKEKATTPTNTGSSSKASSSPPASTVKSADTPKATGRGVYVRPKSSSDETKPKSNPKDDVRLQASGYRDTDGGYARRQASFSPEVTSLTYDEAKRPKPSQGRTGQGASSPNKMAAGGMAKGGMSCMKRGGGVKKYAAGGTVSRGDGLSRVKTRCKVC